MTRVKLSDHFYLDELLVSSEADRRKIPNTPTEKHLSNMKRYLVPGLEQVRTLCGNRSVVITSAYRNPVVNRAVGGTPTSAHPMGFAADLRVAGRSCFETARILATAMDKRLIHIDQLILESGRNIVHVSFDPRARMMQGHQPGAAGTRIDWTYFDRLAA